MSDHLLVRGDLILGAPHTNRGYEKRCRYHLRIPKATRTENDNLIQELTERFVNPLSGAPNTRHNWISAETWVIYWNALVRRSGAYDNEMLESLTQDIRRRLC
jgi:hypothetical protein